MKPANILIAPGPPEHAYLTDFGLTKRRDTTSGITETGQFMGTVDYVAPEQIQGMATDGRADVYSRGCVLYQCLTGEPPFPRDFEVATLYAHLEESPPKPSVERPNLPKAVDAVVGRAMAKRPDDRYVTCGALGADAAAAAGQTADRGSGLRTRRRWAPAAAVVTAFLVLTGGLAIATLRRSHGTTLKQSGRGGGAGPLGAGLARIDPRTNKLVKEFNVDAIGVATGDGAVWVDAGSEIQKINPSTDVVVAHISIRNFGGFPRGANAIAWGEGAVWVAAHGPPRVIGVDPKSNQIQNEINVWSGRGSYEDPVSIAAGLGEVWAVNAAEGAVVDVDPRSNTVSRVRKNPSLDPVRLF